MSIRNTPQRSTCCRSDPPAFRIACTFFRHCSVCVSTSAPASCAGRRIGARPGPTRRSGARNSCPVSTGQPASEDSRREQAYACDRRSSHDSRSGRLATAVLPAMYHTTSAAIQAHDRIRGNPIQRLAETEERAHGAGRDRARDRRADARARPSSSWARAAPTRACTRCGRWRISICGRPLPAETLRRGINDGLPADIHVLAVDSVPHRFHARHGAVARSYLYQISRRRSAFAKPFVWWVKEPLDLERMTGRGGALYRHARLPGVQR